MPKFCAIDFLSEAQRQRQVFLSYFLVAVPFHLETVDKYAHNGSVDNDSFRKPWLYDYGGFSVVGQEEHGLPLKEAVLKETGWNDRPNAESSTELTVERFCLQDDVMVIPSSNPDSPQITSEERRHLQSCLLSSMSDTDTLSDDDSILPFQTSYVTSYKSEDEDFFLEEPENCYRYLVATIPCIKELCLHLKKKQVNDPFLNSRGDPVCQSHFFRKDCTFLVDSKTKSKECRPVEVLTEDPLSKKDFIPVKAEDQFYLELPVGTPIEKIPLPPKESVSHLVKYGNQEEEEEEDKCLQGDFSSLKKFNRTTCASAGGEKYFLAEVNLEEDFSDMDLKSTIDQFPLTYLHEVPAVFTMGHSAPPSLPPPFDKPSDIELFDIDWKESSQIVSPDVILKVHAQQWKDEKYFGAMSSLLVKEPTVEETVASQPSLPLHQELKEQLKLTPDTGLDLATNEIISGDMRHLVSQSRESLDQSFPQMEAFVLEQKESKDWTQELDMEPLQINRNEDDISYIKVSVSALHGQAGVSMQRSVSKSSTEVTLPKTVSVSSKIAGMVRMSKQELNRKEKNDVATLDSKKITENVMNNFQEKNIFEDKDAKLQTDTNPSIQGPTPLLPDDGGPLNASSSTSHEIKREIKPPKRKSFLDDQLNDFLFLTGVTSGYEKSFKRIKNEWKGGKNIGENKSLEQQSTIDDTVTATEPCEATPTEKENVCLAKEEESIQEDEIQVKKKKKNKSKTVFIKIPDYYQKVLDIIEETGSPIVIHLQREGMIPQLMSFKSLTADDIRSQIKQVYEDLGKKTKEGSTNAKLKNLAQLYVCLATSEAALYCSLKSAITGLSSMLQKYQFIIGDSLDGLREDLSKMQCSLEESCLAHPKMAEMARQINHWFQKKVEKSGEDQDLKILVIVKRESASFSESIVKTVNSIKGLRAVSLDASIPASPMITSKALDSHNCLVVTASQLHQDFLWAQFSLVVEYQFEESPSIWQAICVRQNIRHMGLCIERKPDGAKIKEEIKKEECKAEGSSGHCLKLLCSTKVTENSKLIHYLESRYNIMVLERNYKKILPSFQPPLVYADIIVDVVTGVVLVSSEDVLILGAEGLTHKVNSLSQQFEVLWLLISVADEGKSILHNKAFRRITCQLYSAFAQYSKTGSSYEVKILFGSTIQELAEAIHMISKKAEENISSAWHKEDWIKRQCLTAQASKHEVFLMQFPSINAFTAQVLLTSAPLSKLLANCSADVLVTMAPWVPIKFLKIFEDYVRKEHYLFMEMSGALGNLDLDSKDSLSHERGFEGAATRLLQQCEQTSRHQHEGQTKPSYSDESYHIPGWNVKEEPLDIVGSDFILKDDALSKAFTASSDPFLHSTSRHHHQKKSRLDLLGVEREKSDNTYSMSNIRTTDGLDGYQADDYGPLMPDSTRMAEGLMTSLPDGSVGISGGQYLSELTVVKNLPYNSSSQLSSIGTVHPSRKVTSHVNDLIHHHQRVHPNEMLETYQRPGADDDDPRFSFPAQMGYNREFHPHKQSSGFQVGMDPRLKMQMSGDSLPSCSLFEETGRKKKLRLTDGGVDKGLVHGSSQYMSSGSESYPTIPSKHRRVAYRKVPGMPDGQTQLTFL